MKTIILTLATIAMATIHATAQSDGTRRDDEAPRHAEQRITERAERVERIRERIRARLEARRATQGKGRHERGRGDRERPRKGKAGKQIKRALVERRMRLRMLDRMRGAAPDREALRFRRDLPRFGARSRPEFRRGVDRRSTDRMRRFERPRGARHRV